MRNLKILVLFDSAGTPPADQDYTEELKQKEWLAEAGVINTLKAAGHDVRIMGIYDDIRILIKEIDEHQPDVVFNLTEVFMGQAQLDKNIPALLDLLNIPYTGCGPDALILCNNKALSKKIMAYHRIKVPGFRIFLKGDRVWKPKKLSFPLIVKPLREEASTGISQASYVTDEEHLRERVDFIHKKVSGSAMAEEYIDGRELYVSIMGQQNRVEAFPIREIIFAKVPENEPKVATYKAKWDDAYRDKWGISSRFADDLPLDLTKKILAVCKKAYRALNIDGCARFDCRLTKDNELYILEANGNPDLAQDDEFAESARVAGLSYDTLLTKLINQAFHRKAG